MTTKPYTPEEAGAAKVGHIPECVIEAFNELLSINLVNGRAVVKQSDVVSLIITKMRADPTYYKNLAVWYSDGGIDPGATQRKIFAEHWLNVEALYHSYGWQVNYSKPGYCESGDATFTFKSTR